MAFHQHKHLLKQEFDKFNSILGELLPRYVILMQKKSLTSNEQNELERIESLLIEVNGKIAEIKNKLDQDLFGETIDYYYKMKEEAKKGDIEAKENLKRLRRSLIHSIQGNTFFNWN